MSFHDELLSQGRPIWDAMLQHQFLRETAAGRIQDAIFGNWIQQDYLFVREAVRFISVLVSRAPFSIVNQLATATTALHSERALFERMASEKGIPFQNLKITPTCHAYVQFMLATAHAASFEEGFTLLYGAEKAYFDCWTWVHQNLQGTSPWQAFIERWSGDAFRQWIHWLEATLDEIALDASPSLREKMIEIFLLTGQYELLFWNIAWRGESWPVQSKSLC